MSVDQRVRERILKVVEDVRKAAVKHNANHGYLPTASIHPFPAKSATSQKPEQAESGRKLHLMLPKPHTSIW